VPQSVTEVRVVVAKVDAGYRASKMSGSTVYNSKKEKIGTVDNQLVLPEAIKDSLSRRKLH